jgi:ubiquinone/menaquinone biosynthesis C-methylase UbiE
MNRTGRSVSFDRAAGFYDETRGFPAGEEANIAALIAQAGKLTPNKRLLEIGIGTGRISAPLTRHCRRIYGIDLSMPMMHRIRSKPGGESIRLVQGDAEHLPFAADSFDRVLIAHVLHLVTDIYAAIAELARVLHPDGCLLHCWNERPETFKPLRAAWEAVMNTPLRADRWQHIAPTLEHAGWRPDGDPYRYSYELRQSPQDFINVFKQRRWSSTWALTDEEVTRGIAAMEESARSTFDNLSRPMTSSSTFLAAVYHPPEG